MGDRELDRFFSSAHQNVSASGSAPEQIAFAEIEKSRTSKTPLFRVDSKECMRCHPQRETAMPRLDYQFFKSDHEQFKTPTAADRSAWEVQRYKNESDIDKALHVISRLPQELELTIDGKKATLKTDFPKLLEAVPTVQPGESTKKLLSAVDKISLDGDRVTVDMKDVVKFPINKTEALVGKMLDLSVGNDKQQVSLDTVIDKKGERLTLKNIQGINVNLEGGKHIGIRELSLDTSSQATLRITFDNPREPIKHMENLWPKTITLPLKLESITPGVSADFARSAISLVAAVKSALQNRDEAKPQDAVQNSGLKERLQELATGISSLKKSGDQFEITRTGDVIHHDLGGAELTLMKTLRFKFDHGTNGTTISNIDGISLRAPVPSKLGIGDNYITCPSSVSLSAPYGSGRSLTVRADNVIQSATVNLGNNLQPRTDEHGNYNVDTVIKNPLTANERGRLNFRFRFDQSGHLQNKPSEMMDFVSRASWQAADLSSSGPAMVAGSAASKIAAEAMWLVGK